MKKLLMGTAALAGLALVAAAPARAGEPALQLGVSGFIAGYGVYTDQDETGAADNLRSFDFRKSTEVNLSGEVALDNGITAGANITMFMDRADGGATVEQSYMHLSSSWGRVNFGETDGVGVFLQVVAPSADENVDGVNPEIGTFNNANVGNTVAGTGTIEYSQNDFGFTNKLSYFTPVFNGFQAGVSYTPSVNVDNNGTTGALQDDDNADLENGWEIAARYEGSFEALDIALGAAYAGASQEVDNAGDDDLRTWNVGVNLGWEAFDFGVVYATTNNSVDANNGDTDTWVAGVNYTTGPYRFGASYLNRDTGDGATGIGAEDEEIDRWTVGGIYEWGPGMTFRGSVQFQDAENVAGVAADDRDATQVAIGTQINF